MKEGVQAVGPGGATGCVVAVAVACSGLFTFGARDGYILFGEIILLISSNVPMYHILYHLSLKSFILFEFVYGVDCLC